VSGGDELRIVEQGVRLGDGVVGKAGADESAVVLGEDAVQDLQCSATFEKGRQIRAPFCNTPCHLRYQPEHLGWPSTIEHNRRWERVKMQMIFLGKDTEGGESPTLFATDQDSYIIQGYVVTDGEILAKLDIPEGQTVVEVYARLFAHLIHDGVSGVVASWLPPIVHVMANGNYIIQGVRLAEDDTRRRMAIPDHEDAVVVPKAAIHALLEEAACN
jgi:hypothetical protein